MDVMVFETPGTKASFELEPYTATLLKAYEPFISFSDGAWGVLEGQFRAAPVDDLMSILMHDGNGETWPIESFDYVLTVISDRDVFHEGENVKQPLELKTEGDGIYLYVGNGAPVTGENFAGFIDVGLPDWIKSQLDSDLAIIFGQLSDEWKLDLPQRAEIIFAFGGAEEPGLSQTGGAIKNQLSLNVAGDALLEPDASITDFFRWFLTHEAAHLYQIAAGMKDQPREHGWLHEGVANTMAHRIGGRIASNEEAFLGEVYGAAFSDCAAYLAEGDALVEAVNKGRYDAYYACGDFIALITEAELKEGDIFDFWRTFLIRAKTEYDGAISAELYFDHARFNGVSEKTIEEMKALIFRPVARPKIALFNSLESARLSPVLDETGNLISLSLPD